MLSSLPADQFPAILGLGDDSGGIPTMAPVLPSPTREATPTTAIFIIPTATPESLTLLTATPEAPVATVASEPPTATPLPLATASVGTSCIPDNSVKTGKVVEIIDGYTIKVYMDGAVYIVRYAGIEAPEVNSTYGRVAFVTNSDLAYGKEVTLIADEIDQDAVGRLLRYVKEGNTFINLELIKLGLAVAVDEPQGLACAQTFRAAEQAARSAKVGQWNMPAP
jgi:endonuclease YncB( thermonuclease family)